MEEIKVMDKRKELIDKLLEVLKEKNITNDTDVSFYEMWIDDGWEDHMVKHIQVKDDIITFVVYPDMDEYEICYFDNGEIGYVIDCLLQPC